MMKVHRWILLRRLLRVIVLAAVVLGVGGCAQALVSIPFDVSRHMVIRAVTLPIDSAEIVAKGVVKAVLK